MKKLEKLSFNSEKVIKNKELVNLKGGYDGPRCLCRVGNTIVGVMYGILSSTECESACTTVYGSDYTWLG